MTVFSIGTTQVKIAVNNKNRTLLTITNDHATAKLYVDEKEGISSSFCEWVVLPKETLIFDGQGDYPDRAYWAISDTASTTVIVGGQYKDEKERS